MMVREMRRLRGGYRKRPYDRELDVEMPNGSRGGAVNAEPVLV